jgi:hypothetical protein
MYDSGKEVNFNDTFNPNDVACLLKEYLRCLPEPLLTKELYQCFLSANKIKDTSKKLQIIRYLICLLPVANRDTLQVLLKLLDKIRMYSAPKQLSAEDDDKQASKTVGNKMDAFNLAMVFGPNLLKKSNKPAQMTSSHGRLSDHFGASTDKYNMIDDIDSVISITKYLIENHNIIFNVSVFDS